MTADDAPRDLGRLLRPRSVAIVGVSPEPGSLGGAILANLERFGFPGAIHLVSRGRSEINGRPCAGAIDDLPDGIDVAMLALPAAAAREAVAACARREIGTAMVFAAGFAETGPAGRAAQEEMARVARAAGMALVGPNCLGGANYSDGVPLTYEPVAPLAHVPAKWTPVRRQEHAQPIEPAAPAIGIVAQSGAMASTLRFALLAKGLAVSLSMSTGNEADLGLEDFLAALVDDARTHAITIFAEQIRRPRVFLAIAARAQERGKPIVLMHPGRSRRARDSALTHTGALATDHAVMAALLAHRAVVLVDTIEELIDTAEFLARFPRAPTQGAAVLTNSGAFKGFALDFCAALGLDLPPLAPATLDALKRVLPPFATIDNPLDTTGQTVKDPWLFRDTAAALLADPAIGSAVAAIVPGAPAQAAAKLEALLPPLAHGGKPVALAVMGDEVPLPEDFSATVRRAGVPFFRSPERALRALAHVTAYGCRRAAAAATGPAPAAPDIVWPCRGMLPEYLGKAVLAQLGIAAPLGAVAQDAAAARAIAAEIGYPVALKAQSVALPHKSDVGGVVLDLNDETALADAWESLHRDVAAAKPGLMLDGVLVERMAPGGLEMAIGARRDPDWGPVVMVGLGGVFVEAFDDVRFLPPDLSAAAIAAEIGKLKGARLLGGFRGEPTRDVPAFADAAARIGALMRARPEVREIDINPLLVLPQGEGVLALDVLMVIEP